ncbi:hypothetical protein [Ostreiculturibacter nitratireducens]|uniref:hypothetical protein n=1 Tax=Ostreiculturibacter nitratireducens TaxID=3075226 RepID=UPI0031B5D5D7
MNATNVPYANPDRLADGWDSLTQPARRAARRVLGNTQDVIAPARDQIVERIGKSHQRRRTFGIYREDLP